ncbi:MAG: complex I NDUFA9 subunit family protein [Rhodovibrionaceae bacterium]|nr:complex I NDUFA9 subunit family protein [Rhodovibrionaceae bacterium]
MAEKTKQNTDVAPRRIRPRRIEDRTVTVFGGTGFIGRYVIKRLAQEGWVIRVAVRKRGQDRFLKPLGNVGQIAGFPCRIQNDDDVRRALDGADAAINLVGILYEKGGQTFDAVHYQAAKRIAETAAELGLESLVQMSALGASEKSNSEYARSKAAGEKAVRKAFPNAAIIRPSIVFGREDSFFNLFAAMARFSPALPLIGGGKTRFQPVFVGDVADAIYKTLVDPHCWGATYELGGPKVYTFKELLQFLLKEIGRRRFLVTVPFWAAEIQGSVLQLLPVPPLTRDQVELLKTDNVVSRSKKTKTLQDLGIEAHHVELVVPTYLERYRPGGRFRTDFLAPE